MPKLTRTLPERILLYSCLDDFDRRKSTSRQVDGICRIFDYYAEPDSSKRQNCLACYPHTNLFGELDGCRVTFIASDGTHTYLFPLIAVSILLEEYPLKFAILYVDDTLASLYRDAVDLQGRRPANAKRRR